MSDFDILLANEKRKWENSLKRENKGMSTMSAVLIAIFLTFFVVKLVFIFIEPKVEGVTEYWDEVKHPNGVITREKKYSFTPPTGGITIKKASSGKP